MNGTTNSTIPVNQEAIAVFAAGLLGDAEAGNQARLAPTDLIGAWSAVRVGNRPLPAASTLTLVFTAGGRFRAKSGPVDIQGRYTIARGELKFVTWVRSVVTGDRAAELIDLRMSAMLEHARSWRVVDGMLLSGNGGSRPLSLFLRVEDVA